VKSRKVSDRTNKEDLAETVLSKFSNIRLKDTIDFGTKAENFMC